MKKHKVKVARTLVKVVKTIRKKETQGLYPAVRTELINFLEKEY